MKRLHKFFAVTFLIALLTIALAATAGATELKPASGRSPLPLSGFVRRTIPALIF